MFIVYNRNVARNRLHHICPHIQPAGCFHWSRTQDLCKDCRYSKTLTLGNPIFPSQVFDTIYPLTDLAILQRSSKFLSAGTSCIQSYCVILMMLGHIDNDYDVTNGVVVTLVERNFSKINPDEPPPVIYHHTNKLYQTVISLVSI